MHCKYVYNNLFGNVIVLIETDRPLSRVTTPSQRSLMNILCWSWTRLWPAMTEEVALILILNIFMVRQAEIQPGSVPPISPPTQRYTDLDHNYQPGLFTTRPRLQDIQL